MARIPLPTASRAWLGAGLSADFWRLWSSAAFANLADGILFIAIQLVAVRLGASPAELAAITFASRVPMLALGLVAGGLADRLDRRRAMAAIQLLRVTVAAALLVLTLTGQLTLPSLALASVVLGVGEAFFDTNAQSLIPMVAGRERLVAANGRLSAVEIVMGTFLGPPVGAFLVAVSVPLALGSALAGFLAAAVGLALMRGAFRPPARAVRRHLAVEIWDGVRFIGRNRVLLTLTVMMSMLHLGSSAVFALVALYALAPGPIGLTEPEFGLLFVLVGAGSLVGSAVTGSLVARLGRAPVLLLGFAAFGLGFGVPAVTASAGAVGLGFCVAGAGNMAAGIVSVSVRQAIAPLELMGRIHATYRTTTYLAGVLGAVLAGAIGELVGLREAFAVGSAIILLGLLGGLVVTERRILDAEAASRPGRRSLSAVGRS